MASILLIVFLVGLVFTAGSYLFNYKKASAEGRVMIWKISGRVIANNILFGCGYGRFEHDYNIEQAKYFSKGQASSVEIANASHVQNSYNEFIEITAEGGIVGITLFLYFIFLMLQKVPKRIYGRGAFNRADFISILSYAGLLSFIVMSLFNISTQEISVMCLLIICCAKLNYPTVEYSIAFRSVKDKNYISWVIGFVGIILIIWQAQLMKLYRDEKRAADLAIAGKHDQAMKIYRGAEQSLRYYDAFWLQYCSLLVSDKDYKHAIIKLRRAIGYFSNPDLYYLLGQSYKEMRQFDLAEKAFRTMMLIEPNRLKPKYGLMKMYLVSGEVGKAAQYARMIIEMKPKVETATAVFYKTQANEIIHYANLTNDTFY